MLLRILEYYIHETIPKIKIQYKNVLYMQILIKNID